MPIKRRESKRRVPVVSPAERTAILAGLRRQECPEAVPRWLHFVSTYPARQSRHWPKIREVFSELPRAERRKIIRARRAGALGAYTLAPDPENDPRKLLRTDMDL